jgi:hypothetical protein
MRTAKHSTELSKQHVGEQEALIRRQRALIATLEKEGHEELWTEARSLVQQMFALRHQMQAEYVQAEQRLTQRRNQSQLSRARATK